MLVRAISLAVCRWIVKGERLPLALNTYISTPSTLIVLLSTVHLGFSSFVLYCNHESSRPPSSLTPSFFLHKMPRISSIMTAAALASTAFAAPAPQVADVHGPAGGFTVQQVAGPKVLKNGPAEIKKTYAKFNATMPASIATNVNVAVAALQSGTVAANPESYDESYLCPVTVGSTVGIPSILPRICANYLPRSSTSTSTLAPLIFGYSRPSSQLLNVLVMPTTQSPPHRLCLGRLGIFRMVSRRKEKKSKEQERLT
jgi:hypothetical protein